MSLALRILRKLKLLPSQVSTPVMRRDLKEIAICENLSFLVYWKILKIGKGPAVILRAFDKEILKFDCFGEKDGHYHIAPYYDFRIYFCENSVEEQIRRTIQELQINGLRYLKQQAEPKIRALKPVSSDYITATKEVEKLLRYFSQNIKEIQ